MRKSNYMKFPGRIGAGGTNALLSVIVLWIMGILVLHAIVPGHFERVSPEPVLQAAVDTDSGDEPDVDLMALPSLVFTVTGSPEAAGACGWPQNNCLQPFEAAYFYPINGPPQILICSI